MGVYDTVTWHADLPKLPDGIQPCALGFQTKSLPGCCQRMIEVTHEGQLQHREYIGEVIDPANGSVEIGDRLTEIFRIERQRRISGETLGDADYSTQPIKYSGDVAIYASYGTPPNGRLEFYAVFKGGMLQSVQLTTNREPDQKAWDAAHQGKAGAMKQFVVQIITDNSKEFGDD